MIRRLRLLAKLFRERNNNAVVARLSPLKGWRGVVTRVLFVAIAWCGFAFLPALSPDHEAVLEIYLACFAWILAAVPIVACVLLTRKIRNPAFVQDVWMTRMSAQEVAFGICYWPTVLTAVATATVLLGSGTLLMLYGESNGRPWDGWLMAAMMACAPLAMLPVTLRAFLNPAHGIATCIMKWIREVVLALVGGYCVLFSLLGAFSVLWAFATVRTYVWELLSGGCALAVVALFRSLLRRAGDDVFASVEAANLLPPVDEQPRPLLPTTIRARISSLAVIADSVYRYLILILVVVVVGIAFAGIDGSGWDTAFIAYAIPGVACPLAILSVAISGAFARDRVCVVNRSSLMTTAEIAIVPSVLGPWLVCLLLLILAANIAPATWFGSPHLGEVAAYAIGTLFLQLVMGLALVPRGGRRMHRKLGIGLSIGAILLIGLASAESLRSTRMEAVLMWILTTTMAWLIFIGRYGIQERLILEAIEQENSR